MAPQPNRRHALVQQGWTDAPARAAELFAVDARLTSDLLMAYNQACRTC